MYKKLKKQNGEAFAQTLRNFHNGLLEIPNLDVILKHAGQDAEPLLPYLMSLLAANDTAKAPPPAAVSGDPFALLDAAGYDAFHADTLEKQNSIKRFFQPGELLCTFNDTRRFQNYHIVHAVKKDVAGIQRRDFTGKEKREDAYGTSVISIQMLKSGGFISIKNRYNHAVTGSDNTFGSNPDSIISGLSDALRNHFNVEFSVPASALPEGFVLINGQAFKYHSEQNNVYYGDQAWVKDGVIHTVDRNAGEAMFDQFLFDNKTKTLKKIDPGITDSFADDFNRCYGGNPGLSVRNGNLILNDLPLIGAADSQIKTLHLPALTAMSEYCLSHTRALTQFDAPALTTMGNYSLFEAPALTRFDAHALTTMGHSCLFDVPALTRLNVPALTTMWTYCLSQAHALTQFDAPALTTMGNDCLTEAITLTQFNAPALTKMGDKCLSKAHVLTQFDAPALTTMGKHCLSKAHALTQFDAPALTTMGDNCLCDAHSLTQFDAPALTTMGNKCLCQTNALTRFNAPALTMMAHYCLFNAPALTQLDAPALTTMESRCLSNAPVLTQLDVPTLTTMGHSCLHDARALTQFDAPALTTMEHDCLSNAQSLTRFDAPALTTMEHYCLYNAPVLTQLNAPALTTMGNCCLSKAPALTAMGGKTAHTQICAPSPFQL